MTGARRAMLAENEVNSVPRPAVASQAPSEHLTHPPMACHLRSRVFA